MICNQFPITPVPGILLPVTWLPRPVPQVLLFRLLQHWWTSLMLFLSNLMTKVSYCGSTQVASILGKSIDTCEICLWRRSQTWQCYWSLSTMGDTRLNVILFAPLFSFDWRYYVLSRPYCFYSWRSFRRNSFITMIHGQQRKNHY